MTPDARLSAAERAALASIEAAAAADDPELAARLRGSPSTRVKWAAPRLVALTLGTWARLLQALWLGVPLTTVGLALIVVGMGTGRPVAVAGAVVTAFGLRLAAGLFEGQLRRRKSGPPA